VLIYSGFFGLPEPRPSGEPAAVIARGRKVYVAEGCINCHSQYVRPHTPDEIAWGPARPVSRAERPPLIGNRRQGPDLMNVGLRRGAIWQRQHLIDPSSVSPGSRMPSYAALFDAGDIRGADLVEYLGSLGEGYGPDRVAAVAAWSPQASPRRPSPTAGAETFRNLCATCHGAEARGNGPTAPVFQQPAMDLCKGNYLFIPKNLDAAGESVALARVVKFGVAGLNMPGHETLSDRAIMDLVAYIRKLNGRASS
jgi:cytochrome c oxidase cbb3-type subunit 2